MPSASFSHKVSVHVPIDDVWARLNEADTWRAIGPVEDVTDPRMDDEGHLQGFLWHTTVGPRSIKGTADVIDSTPKRCMAVSLDAGELVGILTAVIEPHGVSATDLEVTMAITSKGGMASLFFPVISEALGRGMKDHVEEFAATLG